MDRRELGGKTKELGLITLTVGVLLAVAAGSKNRHPEVNVDPQDPLEGIFKPGANHLGQVILNRAYQENNHVDNFSLDPSTKGGVKFIVETISGPHEYLIEADMKALDGHPDPSQTYRVDVTKLFPNSTVPVAEGEIISPLAQTNDKTPEWRGIFQRFSTLNPKKPAVITDTEYSHRKKVTGRHIKGKINDLTEEALIYPTLPPADNETPHGTPA